MEIGGLLSWSWWENLILQACNLKFCFNFSKSVDHAVFN